MVAQIILCEINQLIIGVKISLPFGVRDSLMLWGKGGFQAKFKSCIGMFVTCYRFQNNASRIKAKTMLLCLGRRIYRRHR